MEDETSMEDNLELVPSTEPMTPEEKQARLAELREWRAQVEAGAKAESVPDDMDQIDKIDEMIRKLEQE